MFILRNEGSKEHFILQQGLELLLSVIESFAPGSSAEEIWGLEQQAFDPWVNTIKKVRPRGAGGGEGAAHGIPAPAACSHFETQACVLMETLNVGEG